MTPAARLAAAIEVLDRIAASHQPSEHVLKAWGAANRYAGSKDRRAIADRVYLCLRTQGGRPPRRAVLASLALEDRLPASDIEALFSGEGHAPARLTVEEAEWLTNLSEGPRLPNFLEWALRRGFGDAWRQEVRDLLLSRAPVDVRINALRADPQTIGRTLEHSGLVYERTPFASLGLRLQGSPNLQALDPFKAGVLEVQDEGSQIAALLVDARPGETVVDYCAGGGGKTLALAATMGAGGRLVACDVNAARLATIQPRLQRAGAKAELRRLDPLEDVTADLAGQAHRVLVDAPCSGSGVWRRRPEEAWRLTPEALADFNRVQAEVLAKAAVLVRVGGRLAYVTCSVLCAENQDVAGAFAAAHPEFSPVPIAEAAAETALITRGGQARLAELAAGGHTVQLSPRRTGTDGFFIALFERTS